MGRGNVGGGNAADFRAGHADSGKTGCENALGTDEDIIADGDPADLGVVQELLGAGIVAEDVDPGCHGHIVTNGDQTDTIWEYLARGESWEAALRTRMFEDDGPNWTPRISGLQAGDGSYKMSILKAADAQGTACARFFYEYPAIAGLGHFLHTYVCDGNPVIPTFQGEPERVEMMDDMDAFTDMLWNSLNEDNKVSLFVRYIDIATGKYETKIINRYAEWEQELEAREAAVTERENALKGQ